MPFRRPGFDFRYDYFLLLSYLRLFSGFSLTIRWILSKIDNNFSHVSFYCHHIHIILSFPSLFLCNFFIMCTYRYFCLKMEIFISRGMRLKWFNILKEKLALGPGDRKPGFKSRLRCKFFSKYINLFVFLCCVCALVFLFFLFYFLFIFLFVLFFLVLLCF